MFLPLIVALPVAEACFDPSSQHGNHLQCQFEIPDLHCFEAMGDSNSTTSCYTASDESAISSLLD
jgi:hypothetical protein